MNSETPEPTPSRLLWEAVATKKSEKKQKSSDEEASETAARFPVFCFYTNTDGKQPSLRVVKGREDLILRIEAKNQRASH